MNPRLFVPFLLAATIVTGCEARTNGSGGCLLLVVPSLYVVVSGPDGFICDAKVTAISAAHGSIAELNSGPTEHGGRLGEPCAYDGAGWDGPTDIFVTRPGFETAEVMVNILSNQCGPITQDVNITLVPGRADAGENASDAEAGTEEADSDSAAE
jgi:hypothetical protein